jgi:hypothetical protein
MSYTPGVTKSAMTTATTPADKAATSVGSRPSEAIEISSLTNARIIPPAHGAKSLGAACVGARGPLMMRPSLSGAR